MRKYLTATALVFSLAGCGGSSSSGVSVVPGAPTSAPSPSPTSTPTPTPTATTLLNLGSTSQNFAGLDSVLLYQRSSAGALSGFKTFPTEAVTPLVYDGASRSLFHIYAASNIPPHNSYPDYLSVLFGAAQKDSAQSTSSFTIYRNTDSGARYTLTLLAPGGNNPQVGLSYLGIGSAEGALTDASTAGSTNYYSAFSYGFFAEANAVPGNGTGTFTGIVIGRAVSATGSHVYNLTGAFTLQANFADKTFSGTVTLTGMDDKTGATVSLGSFPVAMNGFPSPLNVINAYIGGGRDAFRANLGGPAADELAGAFALTIPDPNDSSVMLTVSGAVAARR